jgi:S1-C subfamily serine protease
MSAGISPEPSQNVVGVGIGENIVDNKPTGALAIKFFVRIKLPKDQLTARNMLPKTVDGLPVDVEQSGTFRRFQAATRARRGRARRPRRRARAAAKPNPRLKIRPAQPGCSIGFRAPGDAFVMAGTFGAVVKDRKGMYILSNNHVIADENRLPVGSPIFQPGFLDGGKPATDQIATLTKVRLLRKNAFNKIDAAIAKVLKPSLISKEILFIGPPKGTATAKFDMIVHKFGRTTSYRAGRVTSIETDVNVEYDTGIFKFENQIIITGLSGQMFSDSGDSGSLILERGTNKAVGLLFAGSPSHTIANHVSDALKPFKVTLA